MNYLTYLFCNYLLSWTSVGICICVSVSGHFFSYLSGRLIRHLPPGPFPLPIVGNVFNLGLKPHISLTRLARIHGPIMCLRLGSLRTIVVSSSSLAKEVMREKDSSFSYRFVPDILRACNHSDFSMAFLPPTDSTWRNLRKISNSHIFSTSRLEATSDLRIEKVRELVEHVESCRRAGVAVEVGEAALNASLNLLSNTFFSLDFEDLAGYVSGSGLITTGREFKRLLWDTIKEAAGKPNVSDFFPLVKDLDLLGLRQKTEVFFKMLLDLFQAIVDKRILDLRRRSSNSSSANVIIVDALDAILSSMMTTSTSTTQEQDTNEAGFDSHYIPHMILDLFIAGTHTTSTTLEWAMTELLINAPYMKKAQQELERVVGKGNIVTEAHISNLPYLQALMKETFRLHPALPFLLPRKVVTDVELSAGFIVPKDSQVLVNIWAINRDPTVWVNADTFEPNRFVLGSSVPIPIDVKGNDFQLTPFGAGRRICPGLPLVMRMLPLMLASLIHSFDWKLENGVTPQNMDMEDHFGIALQKAQPLRAIPVTK